MGQDCHGQVGHMGRYVVRVAPSANKQLSLILPGNQWVSYDDDDTFDQKRKFANSRCLGGTMVSYCSVS